MPELDLERVEWCAGLPWFMGPRSRVSGMVLPHPWRRGRVRVFLRAWERLSPEGQGLLIHEAVHACQYQMAQRPWALGLWHPFLLRYLASWTRTGYLANPLELPAYRFEEAFMEAAFEHPDPEAELDRERLSMGTPPGLILYPPWPGEGREAWWRYAFAALLLLPAALLYAVVELLAAPVRSISR